MKKSSFFILGTIGLVGLMQSHFVCADDLAQSFKDAYDWAYKNEITTQSTIEKANMQWKITRAEMAKMISNFSKNILWDEVDASKKCSFTDIEKLDSSLQTAVIESCQLGLMWQWVEKFRPNDPISRAEFWTVLSRALRWDKNEWWSIYYENHLKALQQAGIMNNISNPKMSEIRGYVMLMLMRSSSLLLDFSDFDEFSNYFINYMYREGIDYEDLLDYLIVQFEAKWDKVMVEAFKLDKKLNEAMGADFIGTWLTEVYENYEKMEDEQTVKILLDSYRKMIDEVKNAYREYTQWLQKIVEKMESKDEGEYSLSEKLEYAMDFSSGADHLLDLTYSSFEKMMWVISRAWYVEELTGDDLKDFEWQLFGLIWIAWTASSLGEDFDSYLLYSAIHAYHDLNYGKKSD